MSTALKETIQNRATNQSAAWTLILAIAYPLIAYFTGTGFEGIPTNTNLVFCFALIGMLLLFISNDKKQEHRNSAAKLTNPKIMEQNLDRQESFMQGWADIFKEYKEQMKPVIVEKIVEKIVEVEVPVEIEKVIYRDIHESTANFTMDNNTTDATNIPTDI